MSKKRVEHCSCNDSSCKMHPSNHEKGCTPCIESNLKNGEIPSCFFNAVDENIAKLKTFTYHDFTEFYRMHNPDNTKGNDVLLPESEEKDKSISSQRANKTD